MPLFGRNRPPTPPPPATTQPTHSPTRSPTRSRGFFSTRRSPSPEQYHSLDETNGSTRGGFFSRRRSSSSSGSSSGHRTRLREDPTIIAARQKISEAEAFEREADMALGQARAAVKSAKEHVRILEHEALEEVRRGKMKQAEAKTVSKSARGLGRHGR